jgi:hypothetical protein
MSYIRKTGRHWQCLIRIKDHPNLSKTFKKHEDAKRWSIETELKIRREDAVKKVFSFLNLPTSLFI